MGPRHDEKALDSPSTTTATQPPKDEERCPLKKLPAELRNYIFSLAIVSPSPVKLYLDVSTNGRDKPYTKYPIVRRKYPEALPITGHALASTCRQFHQEALSVFYQDNTFTLTRREVDAARHSGPTYPGMLDKQLAKAKVVVLNVRDEGKEGNAGYRSDAGKLHITFNADGCLAFRGSGALEDRCMCLCYAMAHKFTSIGDFVEAFQRLGYWGDLDGSARETMREKLVCDKCGGIHTSEL